MSAHSITPLFSDDELSGEDDNVSMDLIEVSDNSPVWEQDITGNSQPSNIIPEEDDVDATGKLLDYEVFSSWHINFD